MVRMAAARAFDDAPASWSVTLHDSAPTDADAIVFGPDVDAHDGIVFDPARPEHVIEQVRAAAAARERRVIVVTGASGGAGVTTVALHLAGHLSAPTTCLVEAGPRGGAAERLGLAGRDTKTWADAGDSGGSLRLAAVPLAAGFRALLAPTSADGAIPAPLFERACAEFERLIVDVPAEVVGPEVTRPASAAVLVMPPTAPGAHRARALLDRWPELPWAIVSNRTGPGSEMTRSRLQRILGRAISLELPCCASLRDAEDEGRLVTAPWSRWGRGLRRLCRTLERTGNTGSRALGGAERG